MKKLLYLGLRPTRKIEGYEVLHCPLITTQPLVVPLFIWEKWDLYTHVILTSRVASELFLEKAIEQGVLLHQKRFICLGAATAEPLIKHDLPFDLAIEESQEGVIAYLEEGVAKLRFGPKSALFEQDPDSAQIAYSHLSMSICAETGPVQKSSNLASKASVAIPSKEKKLDQKSYFLLPRSSLARKEIDHYLRENGYAFDVCNLYDTKTRVPDPLPDLKEIDAIFFTSPSTVIAFYEVFGALPEGKTLLCQGSVTEAALERLLVN